MAKLYALTNIIMPDGTEHPRKTVFDASAAQAKQFNALKAARPATEKEIKAAAEQTAHDNGTAYLGEVSEEVADTQREQVDIKPDSGAPGDPQSKPKAART